MKKFKRFVARIDEADRFDERHLLPIAAEIFGETSFPLNTEYIALSKRRNSDILVTARKMTFESYYSFVSTDFFEGLHSGHYPRRFTYHKTEPAMWPGVHSKANIYNGDYQSDCEFLTDALNKNGVPLSCIYGEDKSGHTRDNAFCSKKIADENGLEIKTAIIVCKAFHARRCLMLYSLAFPDTKFYVCPVVCMGITKENWYKTEQGIDRVLGELARCGNQFVSRLFLLPHIPKASRYFSNLSR